MLARLLEDLYGDAIPKSAYVELPGIVNDLASIVARVKCKPTVEKTSKPPKERDSLIISMHESGMRQKDIGIELQKKGLPTTKGMISKKIKKYNDMRETAKALGVGKSVTPMEPTRGREVHDDRDLMGSHCIGIIEQVEGQDIQEEFE